MRLLKLATRMRRVLEWLVSPSIPSLISMAIVVLAFLAFVSLPSAAFYRVTDNLLGYEKSFPEGGVYLFGRLSRMFATEPKGVRVAVIGGSTMRESLTSEALLAEQLSVMAGIPVEVIDLTSSGQLLSDSVALTEEAVCNGGAQLVIMGLSLGRTRNSSPRNASAVIGYPGKLWAPSKQGEKDRWVRRVGADFKAAIVFRGQLLLQAYKAERKKWANKPSNARGWGRHRYLSKNKFAKKKFDLAAVRHPKEEISDAASTAAIDSIERAVAECGAQLVYAVGPVHPRLLNTNIYSRYAAAHNKMLAWLRQREVAALIDLNEGGPFVEEDFFDWGHLWKRGAIEAAAQRLAEPVAPLLRQSVARKPGDVSDF